MPKPRRQFLKSAAGAAGMAMACDHFAPGALAAAPGAGDAAAASTASAVSAPSTSAPMPMVKVGPYQVSRLIVGSNTFHGYSHFNRIMSRQMTEWYTPERVAEVLRRCEQQGINTWQFSHHERAMADLARHRAEGGKMQWILLSHSEIENDHRIIKEVVKQKPLGIVHHGGSAERKRRAGRVQEIKDFLKSVRDSGVLVGFSTHDPRFLEQVEEENWDVDFYMTSLYYLSRSPDEFRKLLGQRPIGEIYLPEDPPLMFAAIKKTRKPCLCYKVLAAGRLIDSEKTIDEAFRTTFENIKPNDSVIIGMYPRYSDHVAENADRVRGFVGVKS